MNATAARTLGCLALALLAAGCCLRKVTVAPAISEDALEEARITRARMQMVFRVDGHCLKGADARDVRNFEDAMARAFEALLDGQLDLDDYNELARAATDVSTRLVLAAQAAGGTAGTEVGNVTVWDVVKQMRALRQQVNAALPAPPAPEPKPDA